MRSSLRANPARDERGQISRRGGSGAAHLALACASRTSARLKCARTSARFACRCQKGDAKAAIGSMTGSPPDQRRQEPEQCREIDSERVRQNQDRHQTGGDTDTDSEPFYSAVRMLLDVQLARGRWRVRGGIRRGCMFAPPEVVLHVPRIERPDLFLVCGRPTRLLRRDSGPCDARAGAAPAIA